MKQKTLIAVTAAAEISYTGEKWADLFAMAAAVPGLQYIRWKISDMASLDDNVHDAAHYAHIVTRLYNAKIPSVIIPSYNPRKLFTVFVKGDKATAVQAARIIHDIEHKYCGENPDRRPPERRSFEVLATPAFYC